ncbi:MAG: hypothetical protein KDK39_06045, partial [Leptospiraceae bacterium]|nr:hypothetical protein [Leptospiraceae bacterium]
MQSPAGTAPARQVAGLCAADRSPRHPGIQLTNWIRAMIGAGLLSVLLLGPGTTLLAQQQTVPGDPGKNQETPADTNANRRSWPADWSDLKRDPGKIFGSEKEEKYSLNTPIASIEDWPGHYSVGVLWLFRYTDYPQFVNHGLFPFYDTVRSKSDQRARTWVLPLFYSIEDDQEYELYTLLSWYRSSRQSADYQNLIGLWYNSRERDDRFYTIWPLFFYRSIAEQSYQSWTLFVLLHYNQTDCSAAAKAYCQSQSEFISPLHYQFQAAADANQANSSTAELQIISPLSYYHRKGDGSHSWFGWLFWSSGDPRRAVDELLLPFYYAYDQGEQEHERLYGIVYQYERGKDLAPTGQSAGDETSESSLHVWPLYFSWQDPFAETTVLLPFGYDYRSKSKGADAEPDEERLVLPFYYHFESDTASRSWWLPVYYHSSVGQQSSTLLVPFWFESRVDDRENTGESAYWSASPLHYYDNPTSMEWQLL